MSSERGSIALSAYATGIAPTDILDANDLRPVLLGLYGEVGGIMATAKKHKRDGERFPGYERAAREEFGDALWYLAALCRRLAIDLDSLFAEASSGEGYRMIGIASDVQEWHARVWPCQSPRRISTRGSSSLEDRLRHC